MTTQAVRVTLMSANGGRALHFSGDETDGSWNDSPDSVNSLNLYEVMTGEVIDRVMGSYAAGACLCRIWNSQTQKVKRVFCLPQLKGEHIQPIKPVKIQEYDILQVRPYAVPT